jgi:alpha-tubulin suppressor-like RCC1 family protein
MKKDHARILYLAIAIWVSVAGAAEPGATLLAPGAPKVIERGPHHRKWAHLASSTNADGQTLLRTNRYTEISTGLHYWQNGEWAESRQVIDLVAGGAMASQGPHQVGFAANINTLGAINMLTPTGQRLRSHVLGLAYTDAASGQSVLLAQVKDSIGMLVADNQIVYADAFDNANAIQADIRYTYTLAGLEQDIILRADPPGPELFGLDPATTRLEVFTEFIEAPEPTIMESSVLDSSPPERRANMVLPDFINQTLGFGNMRMEMGTAFPQENESEPDKGIPTGKTWEVRQGRSFLIEAVQYPAAKLHLQKLPPNPGGVRAAQALPKAKPSRIFPLAPAQARQENKMLRMAAMDRRKDGFVIDYTLVTSGLSNFTFAADSTYLVTSLSVTLLGTTTIEGGTVVKFTNGTTFPQLKFANQIDCRTSPYHPAIFTSMHDNTLGDSIANSTGNPTNYCGYMVYLGLSASNYFNLHDLRVRHAARAFYGTAKVNADISNCQVEHALYGFKNNIAFWNLRNILVRGVQYAFDGVTPHTNSAEHITFHSVSNFMISGLSAVNLTNSLLIGVTNLVSYNGTGVETNLSDSGVFQTLGAGAHYLANNSVYRNVGTTNINVALRKDLQRRTTFPPLVLAQTNITADLTLAPHAQRGTNAPDLGYHYDPIDYAVSSVLITNATLKVDPGTAIAVFHPTNTIRSGFILSHNAKFQAAGRADSKVIITHYATVQEMANTNWNGPITELLFTAAYLSGSPELRCRFTDFTTIGGTMPALYSDNSSMPWHLTDCEFHGGALYNYGGPSSITNCLFNRSYTDIEPDVDLENYIYNCTVYGGAFIAQFLDYDTAYLRDTVFADSYIFSGMNNSNIAYLGPDRLWTTNANDTLLSSLSFEKGPRGTFYIPTNSALLNAGSRDAATAGLYYYTMLTNQVRETNSVVDIGKHYEIVNVAPLIAMPGALSTSEDTALPISGIYVTDPNGNAKTELIVVSVSHGTLTLASTNGLIFTDGANGSASMTFLGPLAFLNAALSTTTYLPDTNYNGSDTLTLLADDLASSSVGGDRSATNSVSITVVPVNDPPSAGDDNYFVPKNTMLTVGAPGVLGNDSDIESVSLTGSVVGDVGHGTLSLGSNGSFTYTPTNGFIGADSFTYKANDGTNDSAVATVTINVTNAVNTAPAITITSPTNDASFAIGHDVTLTVNVFDVDAPAIGGAVVQVEYLNNGASIGVVTASPFSLTLTNWPLSTNAITAVATDDLGATNSSNITFSIDADCDGDGVSDKQEIRNGTDGCALTNDLPTQLKIVSGNFQVGSGGQFLSLPFVAEVRDFQNQRQTNTSVQFKVRFGGGFLINPTNGLFTDTLARITDTNGQVSVQFRVPSGVGMLSLVDAVQISSLTLGSSSLLQTNSVTFTVHSLAVGFAQLDAGYWHSLALAPDGTVSAWGYNGSPPTTNFTVPSLFNDPRVYSAGGQLGDGGTNNSSSPQAVPVLSNIVAVSAGGYHSAALQAGGTAFLWGHNGQRQMGNGTTNNARTPVAVTNLNDVTAVEAGGYHTLFLRSIGTVYACGRNDYGQLGNGTVTQQVSIVQVSSLTNISAVSAGTYHSLALSNGCVYAWGETNAEQGTNIPVRVTGLSNVVGLAAGRAFSLALDVGGHVWSWGDNEYGQLGQTNTFLGSIASLSNIIAISAGVYHAFALEQNGTLWGWGRNELGQIDTSGTQRDTPVVISDVTNCLSISAGALHNLVQSRVGSTAWGNNSFGQVGGGTTNTVTTPTSIWGTDGSSAGPTILNVFTPLE